MKIIFYLKQLLNSWTSQYSLSHFQDLQRFFYTPASVKNNFSTIISLLNTSFFVSSLIQESGILSSVNWDGSDPTKLKLLYVPKHLDMLREVILLAPRLIQYTQKVY